MIFDAKKRGPLVGLAGVIVTISAFLAILAILSDDSFLNDVEHNLLPDLFDELFTDIRDPVQLYSGDSNVFSYVVSSNDAALTWGVFVMDYQIDDSFAVTISDAYDDVLGEFVEASPVLVDVIEVPNLNSLTFTIQNTGTRPILVQMMFTEDMESWDVSRIDSDAFLGIFYSLIAIIVFMAGIAIIVTGAVLTLVDKKRQSDRF